MLSITDFIGTKNFTLPTQFLFNFSSYRAQRMNTNNENNKLTTSVI